MYDQSPAYHRERRVAMCCTKPIVIFLSNILKAKRWQNEKYDIWSWLCSNGSLVYVGVYPAPLNSQGGVFQPFLCHLPHESRYDSLVIEDLEWEDRVAGLERYLVFTLIFWRRKSNQSFEVKKSVEGKDNIATLERDFFTLIFLFLNWTTNEALVIMNGERNHQMLEFFQIYCNWAIM